MTEAFDIEPSSQSLGSLLDEHALTSNNRGVMLCVKAPLLDAEAVVGLTLPWGNCRVLWSQAEHQSVGLGLAQDFVGRGPERFEQIQRQADAQLGLYQTVEVDSELEQSPRAYGGFAFAAQNCTALGEPDEFGPPSFASPPRSLERLWADFGDARFVLPRWRYDRNAKQASLSVLISPQELRDRRQSAALLRNTLKLQHLLSQAQLAEGQALAPVSEQTPNAEHWKEVITGALSGIQSGEFSKVVAARVSLLKFAQPLALAPTLAALSGNSVSATCFCFRFQNAAFIGATPERLIQQSGRRIETEALAGTFQRSSSEFAAELLRSPKEHAEHAPVLQALIEQLEPVCSRLEFAAKPELKELKHLLHLRTPVSGELKEPLHILELVARLHPTPAVGGVPTEAAVRWIAAHEQQERGWYAGPVGWFDATGDGEFSVALRSGLLSGLHAALYAGGGIVQGSEPYSEYQETELKLRGIRASLRTV